MIFHKYCTIGLGIAVICISVVGYNQTQLIENQTKIIKAQHENTKLLSDRVEILSEMLTISHITFEALIQSDLETEKRINSISDYTEGSINIIMDSLRDLAAAQSGKLNDIDK